MSDFRSPHHLPKRRPRGQPFDPSRLLVQRRGVTPQGHGRYPEFDVMEQAAAWDPVTRALIERRIHEVPPLRFFDAEQAACLRAFCDVALGQDSEPRIPVLELVDAKLHAGRRDGYQFAGLPDDGDLFRVLPGGLDEAARAGGARGFASAPPEAQAAVVGALAEHRIDGEMWRRYDPERVWSVVMRYLLEAFYSHPWAWSEIGFGGPAYPRGYMRLGIDQREPWEGDEARHDDPGLEFGGGRG
jgi:hypothetical protein